MIHYFCDAIVAGVAHKELTVIIPSYNEAHRLSKVLAEIDESCDFSSIAVSLVDDGSVDNTSEVCERFPKITYMYKPNEGKGAAVRFGVTRANSKFVAVLDADGEYTFSDLLDCYERIRVNKEVYAVYGSRYMDKNRVWKKTPLPNQAWPNFLFNYLLTLIVWFRFKKMLSDLLTGTKIYHREAYLAANSLTNGFETDHELTLALLRAKVRIEEVPISYEPRSKSEGKKISFHDGIKALKLVLFK